MTFGALIRETRLRAGIVQRALAHHLGVSQPYLADIELDRRAPPSDARVRAVAAFLGADPEPFLTAAALARRSVRIALQPNEDEVRVQVARELAERWPALSFDRVLAIRAAMGQR